MTQATMHAVQAQEAGAPFVNVELPVPEPNAREVVIKLSAAGVGTWDPWIRSGGNREGDERFPIILGQDEGQRAGGVGVVVDHDRIIGIRPNHVAQKFLMRLMPM